jgi:hypothetical protein
MQPRVEMNYRPFGLPEPAVKLFENRQCAFAICHWANDVRDTFQSVPYRQGIRYGDTVTNNKNGRQVWVNWGFENGNATIIFLLVV